MNISVNTDGARAKLSAMRRIAGSGAGAPPSAALYQLTDWGSKTLRAILTSGILNTRTGHLKRNTDMVVLKGPPVGIMLGTGVGGKKEVKYARIHEQGGEIRPTNAGALTVPLPGVKGVAANYAGIFMLKREGKAPLLCVDEGPKKGLRPLFVLQKKVTMPARHWFSRPIRQMRPELDRMLEAAELWRIAQALGD